LPNVEFTVKIVISKNPQDSICKLLYIAINLFKLKKILKK